MPRLLAFVAMVFRGVSFVATKAVLREVSPVTVIFLRLAIAAIVLLCVVRARPPRESWGSLALMGFVGVFVHLAQRGWREEPRLTPAGWGALLFLAIGCSALGYLFWYGALERVEVSRVAALLYAEPLVTFVSAAILLGERVGTIVMVGGALVLINVLISQYAPAQRAVLSSEEP